MHTHGIVFSNKKSWRGLEPLRVTQTVSNETPDMVVSKHIVGHLTLPAVLHQLQIPEQAKLMRDGRTAPCDDGREITDTQLLSGECEQQFDPGGIGEHLEHSRQVLETFTGADDTQDAADFLLVHMVYVAGVFSLNFPQSRRFGYHSIHTFASVHSWPLFTLPARACFYLCPPAQVRMGMFTTTPGCLMVTSPLRSAA